MLAPETGAFATDVEAVRNGAEATAARAARTASATVWPASADREVRLIAALDVALADEESKAERFQHSLTPSKGVAAVETPESHAARALVLNLRQARAAVEGWAAEAGGAVARWIHESQRPNRRKHDVAVLDLMRQLRATTPRGRPTRGPRRPWRAP